MYKRTKLPKKLIIFSGAGISAPSGISTFRDSNGLWENHNIDKICNEYTWKKNFELVHEFYNQRREQLNNVEPNKGHLLIKELEDIYKEDLINITQNVDDLFERVNVSDTIHLHGELTKMECEACGKEWDIGYNIFDIEKDRCPKCNSLKGVRPKIVFFNGQAPMYKRLYKSLDYLENSDSLVVVIGTMGNVVAINDLIKFYPCKKILCNLEPSEYLVDEIFDEVFYDDISKITKELKEKIIEYFN